MPLFLRSLSRARGVTLAFLVVACHDEERPALATPVPVAPPVATNAWLVVSDSAARAGAEVTIAAYTRTDDGSGVGSFTARFLYDSLQLELMGADSVADGAMRALNPVPGEYRIAGAHATGLANGLLFRLRARVIDPRGLRRLGLLLDELHGVAFTDLTTRLEVRDTRTELFAGMKGLQVERKP